MKKRRTLVMLFLSTALLLTTSSRAAELNWYAKGLQAEYATDYYSAVTFYIKSVNSGVKDANYAVARSYHALGNEEDALVWFIKAANSGNRFAQYDLALIYLSGNSATDIDNSSALKWLTLSAQAKHGEAAYELFKLEKEARWLKIAAEQRVQAAMQALAEAYEKGLYGLEEDETKTLFWTQSAIDAQEEGI